MSTCSRHGTAGPTTRSCRCSTTARSTWASTTLREPLEWQNSALLKGDATDAVATLEEEDGDDLAILGSGALIRSLLKRDLIDEFVLLIHPLVLGSGTRLFPEQGTLAKLRLVDSVPTTTGVIVATYGR